jgi:hypothetical protein
MPRERAPFARGCGVLNRGAAFAFLVAEVPAPGIGKSWAIVVSRSSWSWRVLQTIGQLQFARLRDVPIYQPSAFLCPCDFELGLAILQIGALSAIASVRWLAVDIAAP